MINLAWGGLTNGQIDTSILVDVSGKGDYLEPVAAAKFLAMRDALHAATGVWINPAPGSSAYRPEAIQDAFYDAYLAGTGNVAAKPVNRGGQGSNHGWGRAVDITGYESNTAVWNWLLAHAGDYGYSWATGQASGERWHWESLNTPGTTTASTGATPIPKGFLMALTDAEQAEVLNAVRNLYAADFQGGPSMKDGEKSISQSLAEIHAILAQPVVRDGVKNPQIQELADIKTLALSLTAEVGALQQAVTTIATSQGVNPDAILDAAKAGAQAALQGITLKAVV